MVVKCLIYVCATKILMNKSFPAFSLALLLLAMWVPANGLELVSGKTILVFNGGVFAPEINGFVGNYTPAGNNVINGTSELGMGPLQNYLTDAVNALFLPANDFDGENLTFIKEWFDLGGKLLWVAGDSDFGGYFIADHLNPVLEEVGSVLRLDAGAVEDPVSNDGASYRVVANQLGDGPISNAIRDQVAEANTLREIDYFKMPFHGPTAVYYLNDGVPSDLREENLDTVEVVVMSSPDALGIDQDLSAGTGDFYASINASGNLPLLAVEIMGNNAVVVSGEGVFKDFKNMYGNTLPVSGEFHHGSIVVDTLLSYLWQEVIPTLDSTSTMSNTTVGQDSVQETPSLQLPVSNLPMVLAIAVLVPLRKRIMTDGFSILRMY